MAGGLHHVTARAPKGLFIFRSADDRRFYLELLASEVRIRDWSLQTYCLMTTHLHLLLTTPEPNLGLGIKAIHERFAQVLHRTYDGHGHVFGARFHNRPVLTEAHQIACLRYIARNPVTAGHCRTPADWRWSAHRALAGVIPSPAFLDVPAVHAILPPDAYRLLAATPDARLLHQLAATHPDTWIADAVDDHVIPITAVADHQGIHISTAYRRLHKARANKGTVPSFAGEIKQGP
jgi:REP element-mobilizing transposase RayT